MKFFDCHLHLPTPDERGLDALLRHVENEPGMVGGNLVLNTRAEVDFAIARLSSLPPSLNLVPYYDAALDFPDQLKRSGWYKIHPRISRIERRDIAELVQSIEGCKDGLAGLMVHCYPWGTELEYNISLPLVIELAHALPLTPILASHGGGYESWAFRAHTGMLRNVFYDFSVTMAYYAGSDLLRPFQRYLRYSQGRVVFGSDWPSAGVAEQLEECERLAAEMGVGPDELEEVFMANARRLWPRALA